RPVVGLFLVELGEDRIFDSVDDEGELLAHEAFLLKVANAEADAADLVRVRGSDAAPGRAEPVVASNLFFELVEEGLVAHDHVRLRGEVVDDLAFALVAPLAADQDDDHGPLRYSVPGSGRLVSRL